MSSQRRRALPERLGDAVGEELRRLGGDERILAATARWREAVGPAIAENAWPARLTKAGTLVVHTSSSVWAHELTLMAEMITERLGDACPGGVRFSVGPLPEPPGVDQEESAPPVRPARDAHLLGRARELAAPIANEQLREVVARAIAASLTRSGDDRAF